jgi:hypothetical protein
MSEPTHRVQPLTLDELDARIAEGSVDPNRLAATVQAQAKELADMRETTTAMAKWINEQIASATAMGRKGK